LAIASDYLFVPAFLGASALLRPMNSTAFTYPKGFFAAFIPVLLVIAEPCRNLDRCTRRRRACKATVFLSTEADSASSSVVVALIYMIPAGGLALV
jgi:cation/acetate symporter